MSNFYPFKKQNLTFLLILFLSIGLSAQNIVYVDVWLDSNGNGLVDGGESLGTGSDELTLELWEDTDADGVGDLDVTATYPFSWNGGGYNTATAGTTVPDGDYEVRMTSYTAGSGTYYLPGVNANGNSTSPDDTDDSDMDLLTSSHVFTLTGGNDATDDIAVGMFLPVVISDQVFEDLNGNGINDGEPAYDDVTIEVWDNITGLQVTTDLDGNFINPITPAGGIYTSGNLSPGDYYLRFTTNNVGTDYLTTANATGDTNDSDPVWISGTRHTGDTEVYTLTSGDNFDHVDAGFWVEATVSDYVWEDMNGNGIDDGEPALDDGKVVIDIELHSVGGAVTEDGEGNPFPLTVNNDGLGNYIFEAVPPGDYYVIFGDDPDTGTDPVFYRTQMYAGGSTLTDVDNSDPDKLTGQTENFTLMSDDDFDYIDAGYYAKGTISNWCWHDIDGEGDQDGTEVDGVENVMITIYDNATGAPVALEVDGVTAYTASQNSDVAGNYLFDNLPPGEYYLEFTAPVDYYLTTEDYNGGNTDATDVDDDSDVVPVGGQPYLIGETHIVELESQEENEDIDAGFYKAAVISDFVWEDLNGDGINDGSEPGLDGVTVSLADDAGAAVNDVNGSVVADVVTAGGGMYMFELLPPGTYVVTFDGTTVGGDDYYLTIEDYNGGDMDATDDVDDSDAVRDAGLMNQIGETHEIEIESEEMQEDIDAGFFRSIKIGDFVWCDENGNGIQDDSGAGADGAELTLINLTTGAPLDFDATGTAVNPITVDGTGMYMFMDVPPGEYRIDITLPAATPAWSLTLPNVNGVDPEDAASNDNTDSDVNAAIGDTNGSTHDFTLTSGDDDVEYIDIGAFTFVEVGGGVWLESGNTGDGVYTGPPDDNDVAVTVQIWTDKNCDGSLTELYDEFDIVPPGDMGYLFEEVPPGCYVIVIAEAAFMSGGPLAGTEHVDLYEDASVIVDNDNNGYIDGSISRTSSIEFLSDCAGGVGQKTEIDFGFKFDCDEINDLAATSCEEAEIICNLAVLDGFCGAMTPVVTGNGPSPLCDGFGVPHNISWFAFVAGDGDWTFILDAYACSGDGIQMGVFDGCDWSNNIWCDSDCGGIEPVEIESNIFEPGQTYWMFLDGCSGSVCSYEVTIEGNFIEPDLNPDDMCIQDVGDTDGDGLCDGTTICPGLSLTFEVLGVPENVIFTWSITQDGGTPEIQETDVNLLVNTFEDVGTYTVCIDAVTNGCPGQAYPGSICQEIIVQEWPDEVFPDEEACTKDFPYTVQSTEDPNGDGTPGWQCDAIPLPTPPDESITVTCDATTPEGCEYTQTITVHELKNERGDVFIASCGPTDFLGVVDITESFENLPFDIPMAAANGCDSLVNLTATVLLAEGELTAGLCFDHMVSLTVTGLITDPVYGDPDASFNFIWTHDSGDVICEGPDVLSCEVADDGEYCLTVEIEYLGEMCSFDLDCIDVDISSFLPIIPSPDSWQLNLCEGVESSTLSVLDPDDSYIYNWTVTGGTVQSGQGDESVVVEWTPDVLNPEVCVSSTNVCGDGMDTCMTFTITPAPSSAFMSTDTTCVDSIFTVEYTGGAGGTATFDWNFGGGVGGGTGPGPHELVFGSSGDVEISLQVNEGGCLSDTTFIDGFISSPLALPQISCTSNSTTITFTWLDVAGADGYDVQILDGPGTETLDYTGGTSAQVTGLVPTNEVTIQVTALDGGYCSDVLASLQCVAQDCAPQEINLSASRDTFCFEPSVMPVQIMANVTSGDPGTFTFSSSSDGVSMTGEFDPLTAGVGTHIIQATYVKTDDGCTFNENIIMVVLPLPVNDFSVSDDTICITESVDVNYTGGTSGVDAVWILNDATVNSGDINSTGPINLSWATEGLKEVDLDISKGMCDAEGIPPMNVLVDPLLETPVISCDQALDNVSFDWTSVNNSSEFMVTVVVTDGTGATDVIQDGIMTGTTFDADNLNPGDLVDITVTAISDNACPNTMAMEQCEATSCQAIDLVFDQDGDKICLTAGTAAIPLTVNIGGGNGNQDGSQTWSGPGVSSDGVFDPNTAGVGDHTIYLDYLEDAICDERDSLVISVIAVPNTDFTIDDVICITNKATVNTLSDAGTTTNYTWPTEATVTDLGNGDYELEFSAAGTYEIPAVATNGDCDGNEVRRTIVVEPEIEALEFNSCSPEIDMVSFSWEPLDCVTEYEVFIEGVSQGTQTETTFDVDMLSEGDVVNIAVLPISDCACPAASAMDQCTASPCPDITASLDDGGNNDLCLTSDLTAFNITATLMNDDGTGTATWSGMGVDNNGLFDPQVAGVGSHQISYEYIQDGCNYPAEITINIFEVPNLEVAFDNPTCYDVEEVAVDVLSTGGDGNYSYQLNNEDVTIIDNVMTLMEGQYTLAMTDGNNCSDQEAFTISVPSEPTTSISGPIEITELQTGNFSIDPSDLTGLSIDSIVWTIGGTVVCSSPTCFSISGDYDPAEYDIEVVVHFNDGCMISSTHEFLVTEVFVDVVTFPNILSLNDQDENSTWHLHSNIDLTIYKVQVFDRWGSIVFNFDGETIQLANETNGAAGTEWDGTFNGKNLQPGVYVYYVEYKKGTANLEDLDIEKRSGDITIIK